MSGLVCHSIVQYIVGAVGHYVLQWLYFIVVRLVVYVRGRIALTCLYTTSVMLRWLCLGMHVPCADMSGAHSWRSVVAMDVALCFFFLQSGIQCQRILYGIHMCVELTAAESVAAFVVCLFCFATMLTCTIKLCCDQPHGPPDADRVLASSCNKRRSPHAHAYADHMIVPDCKPMLTQ